MNNNKSNNSPGSPGEGWRESVPARYVLGRYYRMAASGLIPARWYERRVPPIEYRTAPEGRLRLEIVSHCWQYSRLLRYQLSSLVKFPPAHLDVTMTVCFSREDMDTWRLLQRYSALNVPSVTWNWCDLPKEQLFRRAIGRNRAALQSQADWVWFTDCDLMFRDSCLDGLAAALQGRRDTLVFPASEWCTPLLDDEHPMLNPTLHDATTAEELVVDIDSTLFTERHRTRATGPLQIVHGDVARACGYCDALPFYQKPADSWCKAYEDRALRWLLGSQGTPLAIPGVFRIRHASKGRYTGNSLVSAVRGWLRRVVSGFQERRLR